MTNYEVEREEGSDSIIHLNFGPSHPATHGTLRLKVELDGESIIRVEPELGYLHTGFEKLGEHQNYNQFITVTDRMNYLSPLNNNIGFAIAVEELLDIEIPKRTQVIRVIMAELSRISDHLISVGLQGMDLGAFSVFLWTVIERERLYDIFEAVTGTRLTTSYTRIGGLAFDIPDDFDDRVKIVLVTIEKCIKEVELMLSKNRIFIERCKGIGVLKKEDAINYGITGPVLRSSGVNYDIRKVRPYSSYEDFEFIIPVETAGDCYSRYLVRLEEMRQSVSIIRQGLNMLRNVYPQGEINYFDKKKILPDKKDVYNNMEALIHHFKGIMPGNKHGIHPPKGEVYCSTEAPNGELGFHIVSNGTDKPYRVRVRPPSFYNFQVVNELIQGHMIPDLPAVLSTLNIIAGELDR